MYFVYWTYVQSEQEGRRLLPLRLPSGISTADLTAPDSQWKYVLHYNCIRIKRSRAD
jgi:hypothetical protein